MKIDIPKAFATNGEPVAGLLQRPGVGFYIPLYQRDYSWDSENVGQLMEDIRRGVDGVLDDEATAIHFLGTVLLVTERQPLKNIQPLDPRALPPRIDNVIDGQQRLSTLALLAALLYQRLDALKAKLPADHELHEPIETYLAPLLEMFSVDIRRGTPPRKPVIIRGSVDAWTLDGADQDHYPSPVARYLAAVIRAVHDKGKSATKKAAYPKLPERKSSLVGKNLNILDAELKRVEEAYTGKDDDYFPPAWHIVAHMPEEDLWNYQRPQLAEAVRQMRDVAAADLSKLDRTVCSVVQLFAFSHFLLQRCCLTVIEPIEERWAFDMFQSLNATGTPLTAVETFKPLVVNTVPEYKGSASETYLESVVDLLGSDGTVASKTKITNQFLTTLALAYDGSKLAVRFGAQRKWLQAAYEACTTLDARQEFVRIMGDLAAYWREVVGYDPTGAIAIAHTETVPEQDRALGALCALYLQDGGHSIAHSILSRFYSRAVRGEPDGPADFVEACKAVAAFFTLWRSALTNTGLDDVYRSLLGKKMAWTKDAADLTVANLKQHFTEQLAAKGVGTKDAWRRRAVSLLRYDQGQVVSRFALFVAAHDTIADPDSPGLMKIGTPGIASYLEPGKWRSPALRTVEHVAPQRPPGGSQWDPKLYEKAEYDRVGNLTLLPRDINSSASNRRWAEKYIYYRHLMEQDPTKLDALRAEAEANGVTLNSETIGLLKSANYNHHILPLVALGIDGAWDAAFVDRRSERICDILWERVSPWLV